MATRSLIGKVQDDGTIKAIYCHYDGYPECVGMRLREKYRDQAVDELLDPGIDLLSLPPRPGGEREELGDPINRRFKSISEFLSTSSIMTCEYAYLYQNGIWSCVNVYEDEVIDLYKPEETE